MLESYLNYRQLNLAFPGENKKSLVSLEKLHIGSSAFDTLREIIRVNPQIKDFSVIFYDEMSGYDDMMGREVYWQTIDDILWLPRKLVFDRDLSMIADSETGDMLAIGSKVRLLDGTEMHIPMMDFVATERDVRDGITTPEQILSEFSSLKGALLFSGNSYHFWSPNLMLQDEWESYLNNRLFVAERRKTGFYDLRFINKSLQRGFSALRIFGYKGTTKDTEPSIVAITK